MAGARPVAIVTGAATGIGAAVARTLAGDGWAVVVNYSRSAREAEATAEACLAAGGDAVTWQGDVADDGACRNLVQAALDAWGRIDALVNNAGVTRFVPLDDLEGLTGEDFRRILNVNVIGAWQMARAAASALRRSETAAIVNVSSHSGFSGHGSSIAYAASKGALNTLTMSLATALAPEIRVNAVCPGWVDTDWIRGRTGNEAAIARFRDDVKRIAPLKTLTTADDVADAVRWFVTGARTVTGQLLVVDGGTHLTVGTPGGAEDA